MPFSLPLYIGIAVLFVRLPAYEMAHRWLTWSKASINHNLKEICELSENDLSVKQNCPQIVVTTRSM